MILIVGGGLAGLSTALHLGDREHLVVERETEPGGLCRSRTVGGFVFDYTGHLLHLRDPEVIALLDRLLPGAFEQIERRAAIRSHGRLVPYPFQAHTHGLPPGVVFDCVHGFWKSLQEGGGSPEGREDQSFLDWTRATFGEGISRHFMIPYNEKMWRRGADRITADWVAWAVPKPTLEEVLRGALGLDNEGMGYNPRFRYPRRGGIGILPEAFASRVSSLRTGCEVVGVDLAARAVRLSGNETVRYDALVCTAPLPALLSRAAGLPDWARRAAGGLDWVDVYCLNLGIGRPGVMDRHWIYFPEPEFPFYRVGSPTAFSGGVAPEGCSSLYVEVSVRSDEAPDEEALAERALEGLCRAGILNDSDEIVARELIRLSPAYVVFDRARRAALGPLLELLRAHDIHAIGRFGGWSYSYMEAAIKDGIRTARLLRGEPAGAAPVAPT